MPTEGNGGDHGAGVPGASPPLTPGQQHYLAVFDLERFPNCTQRETLDTTERITGTTDLVAAIDWAANKSPPIRDVGAVCKAATGWQKDGGRRNRSPPQGQSAAEKARERVLAEAAHRGDA
jgi:hypothetical protein